MRRKTRKYIDLTTQEKIIILNLIDAKVLTDLGYDGRHTSVPYSKECTKGLAECGIDVIVVGLLFRRLFERPETIMERSNPS